MTASVRTAVFVSAFLVVAVVAFFGGRTLRGSSSPTAAVDPSGEAFDTPAVVAGSSAGGFTGFGPEAGLGGRTVLAGRVASVNAGAIAVESADGVESTIRVSSESRIFRLEAAGREALRPGSTVIVRRAEDGAEAGAVLVLLDR